MSHQRASASLAFVCVTFRPPPDVPRKLLNLATQAPVWLVENAAADEASNLEDLDDSHIHRIRNRENQGLATALNQGTNAAFASGASVVVTLDQDSTIDAAYAMTALQDVDRIRQLFGGSPFLLGPSIGRRTRGPLTEDPRYSVASELIQSGMVIPRWTWDALGPFDDGLFIDCVDTDYSRRVWKNHGKVIVSPGLLVQHVIGAPHRPLPLLWTSSGHNPERRFTISRNRVRMLRRHGMDADFRWIVSNSGQIVRNVADALIDPTPMESLNCALRGVRAGLQDDVPPPAPTREATTATPLPLPTDRPKHPPSAVPIMGSVVHLVDGDSLLSALLEPVGQKVIANHNLHSLALVQKDPELRRFYDRADLVFIDGMPVVWHLRACGVPASRANRLTVLDWLSAFLSEAAQHKRRIFHLGGTAKAVGLLPSYMAKSYPTLEIEFANGFFDASMNSAENDAVLRRIEAFAPDVLLVGMGMPRQELWVSRNRNRLQYPVVCTIGGAFSYLAGEQATPPRWLGRLGLEGAYRMSRDPMRLGHRYVVEPWGLLRPALKDLRNRGADRPGSALD